MYLLLVYGIRTFNVVFCTEQADVRGFFDSSFWTSVDDAAHERVASSCGIHHSARKGGKMELGVAFNDIQTLCSEADKSSIDTLQVGKDCIFDLIAFQCEEMLFDR